MERRSFVKYGGGALGLALLARPALGQSVNAPGSTTLAITLSSVFVDDQSKALAFYTEVLGFVKKEDIPVGQFRWLTVVSADDPDGTELVLEPNDNPAAKTFQQAIFEQGIPATSLAVGNVQGAYERLREREVVFQLEPTDVGGTIIAKFDDTCGNLIQMHQV
jgi:predicted enzyme related to lactoylglutathione lyase